MTESPQDHPDGGRDFTAGQPAPGDDQPVDPVQEGAPATGPKSGEPPTEPVTDD